MTPPRRSVRLAVKRKKLKKACGKKPEKPFPLLKLNNDILCLIIYKLEKGTHYLTFEGHLVQDRFSIKDLKNLSQVNKRLRDLSMPTLFKYTRIADFVAFVPSYVETGRLDRAKLPVLIKTLKRISQKPVILNAIRYLTVEVASIAEITYHYKTPDALWKCLGLMPNLKEINFRLRGSGQLMPLLESHLTHNPNLPILETVRGISMCTTPMRWSPSRDFAKFLKLTPNVEKACIEIPDCVRHCPQLLAVSKLPRLKYLMLCRIVPRPRPGRRPFGWAVDDITAIAGIVPNIKHLALVGQLDEMRDDEAGISDYVKEFAKFTELERLDMTDEYIVDEDTVDEILHDLEMSREHGNGDDESMSADDEYYPDEEDIARDLADDHYLNEDRHEVARKFFDTCPTLRQVYLTRCEHGELFELGDDSEVKMTQSVGLHGHSVNVDHAFGFPRVLEVKHMPGPGPME